jgi:hypothetical protein
VIDDTMQIRGGRGYETALSLANRGERPIPVEQIMRDYRINKIFEGSSEIMHLFMAREAVDKHLQVAGALIDPEKSFGDKLGAFGRSAAFYAWWYPTRWFGWGRWPRFGEFGKLATHMRFVERSSRKLARSVFHGMIVHQAKLQNKQGFLFRLVDVANELLAMSSSVARAHALVKAGDPNAASSRDIADLFCKNSRRKVEHLFAQLWENDDVAKYKAGVAVLDGKHLGLEQGTLGIPERLKTAGGAGHVARRRRPRTGRRNPVGARKNEGQVSSILTCPCFRSRSPPAFFLPETESARRTSRPRCSSMLAGVRRDSRIRPARPAGRVEQSPGSR